MKNFFFIIVILVGFMSCNDKKKQDDLKPDFKENFSLELEVVASKKDDFTLYYTEDNTVSFVGGNAAWKGVNGGNIEEKIIFDLSEEITPTDIRLDFGLNKLQDSVEIKNIKILYYGNEMSIKGSDFFNWFIKDEKFKTKTDVNNSSIKFFKSDNEWITPYFYPRQELIDALSTLTNEKL